MSSPSHTCPDLKIPNSLWSFCPNVNAAYALCVCFGLTFLAHVGQGIYYKKAYTWVIAMSALWQTIAYAFRIVSIQNPASLGDYAGWFVLILIAPLWTNAFVYMVLGRMVWNFTPRARIFRIPAWRFGLIFVILDMVAFAIQLTGAALASTSFRQPASTVLSELHVYMAGVGIQQLFIVTFLVYAFGLHREMSHSGEDSLDATTRKSAMTLLYTLYACLALITTRIIFRLVEYSSGLDSTIPNHEVFQYCLDSLPMLLALVLLNVVHPGRIMSGKESELPSRKARKAGSVCKSSQNSYEAGKTGSGLSETLEA